MLVRWRMFQSILFLGITPKLRSSYFKGIRGKWKDIPEERRAELVAKLEKKTRNKRESMGENAARGNYKFTGIAFIIAASIALFLAPTTSVVSQIILRICIGLLLGGSGLLLIVISAKGKVMRKKLRYVPTGIEIALRAYASERYYKHRPSMKCWQEFVDATYALHKCEMILLAERRGSWLASTPAAFAVLLMIVGVALA